MNHLHSLTKPHSFYSRQVLMFSRGTPLQHIPLGVNKKPLIQDVIPPESRVLSIITTYRLPRTQKSVVLKRTGLTKPLRKQKKRLFGTAR